MPAKSPPFIPPIGLRRRTGSSRDDDDGGDGDGDDANVLLVVLTGGFRVTGGLVRRITGLEIGFRIPG